MYKNKIHQLLCERNSSSDKKYSNLRFYHEYKNNMSVIRRTKKKCRGRNEPEKWLVENYNRIIETSRNINVREVFSTFKVVKLIDLYVSDHEIKINDDSINYFFEYVEKEFKISTIEMQLIQDVFYLRVLSAISNACQNDMSLIPQRIGKLYDIISVDFEGIISHFSPLEKLLRADKSDVYQHMSKATQKQYQSVLFEESKLKNLPVESVCKEKMEVADKNKIHFGFLLCRKNKTLLYYPILILLYAFLLADFAFAVKELSLVFFLALPLYFFTKRVLDFVFSRSVVSYALPSMHVDTVCKENKTAVVITSLITSEKDIDDLCRKLKCFKINNRNSKDQLYFGLLCDFKESDREVMLTDELLKKKLSSEIESLNREDRCFFAITRKRMFHKSEGKYVGWERKRGAIESFIHWLVTGKNSHKLEFHGCTDFLKDTKYLITLDADTQLAIGQAKELIGIASHPLNQPVIKEENGVAKVVSGYGIIQPKMTTSLMNPIETPFGKMFGNGSGEILYSGASFDFMQTLHREGNFCGKGIIHIQSYERILYGKIPEQTILSHDMPEGAFLRCGLASNIYFTDSEPQDAQSYYKRQHRWIRGDVQNLKIISRLPLFRKAMLLENLGRYLVPIFEVMLLVVSSFYGPKHALVASFLILLFHFQGTIESFSDFLLQKNFQIFHRRFFTRMRNLILNSVYKSLMSISAIAFEAYYFTDAFIRALFRMYISRRKLLEWQVYTPFSAKKDPMLFYFPSLILTCFYLCIVQELTTILFGIAWLGFPLTAIKTSTPYKKKKGWKAAEKEKIYKYAKGEFHFFDACVGERTNNLPPDNIQISPREKIALRTSPTNIGLYLVSLVAANDFGFLSQTQLLGRLGKTIDTIEKLETYHGHLFNWYDIENLTVLGDRFVSAVDSGNYIACLICVFSALNEMKDSNGDVEKIKERIKNLIRSADFRYLFDYKKKLFYVGCYPDKKQTTTTHYDHYMSESRLTMFLSIALGQIPSSSWSCLARPILSFNGTVGIGSWSGTTFEYFMPTLFLPVISNSIEDESLEYAYYCQKRFGVNHPKNGTVFGISESGYTLTDEQENYQYKAFGVPYISVQSHCSFPKVLSPYSSFLMLNLGRTEILNNLSSLHEMGLVGDFGFFEACEYNSNFIDDYAVVYSYMSHHKGMSLIALANSMYDNVFVKRFLSYNNFDSKIELLAERFPIEGKVYKKKKSIEARKSHFVMKKNVEKISKEKCSGKIYSDGKISLITFSDGSNEILCNEVALVDGEKGGVLCTVETNEEYYTFLATDSSTTYISKTENCFKLYLRSSKLFIQLQFEILAGKNAVLLRLEVNGISEPCKATFNIPIVLQKLKVYRSHPAFHSLSLEGKSSGKTLTVRKRDVAKHQYLHFISSKVFSVKFQDRREQKSFDYTMLFSPDIQITFDNIQNSVVPLIIQFSESEKATNYSDFCEQNGDVLPELSDKTRRSISKLNEISFYDKECSDLESKLLCNIRSKKNYYIQSSIPNVNQSFLWQFGISGDFKIVCLQLSDEKNDIEKLYTFLRAYKKLRIAGLSFDLVVLKTGQNEYFDFARDQFTDVLVRTKCEFLLGKHPGVHFVTVSSYDEICKFRIIANSYYEGKTDAISEKSQSD